MAGIFFDRRRHGIAGGVIAINAAPSAVPEETAHRRVLVIGAGGHARVCLEALLDEPDTVVVGAVSRDGTGVRALGVPMVGLDNDFERVARRQLATSYCVAIGDNFDRQSLCQRVTESGGTLTVTISRAATLSKSATIMPGSQFLAGSVVSAAAHVGTGVIVNTNATIDHDCRIGDYAHIAPGVAIGGEVTIGSGTLIGIGARVQSGLTIGAGAIIAGGAVVVDDVPAGATVAGIPARPLIRHSAVS